MTDECRKYTVHVSPVLSLALSVSFFHPLHFNHPQGFARLNKWELESTYDHAEAAGAKYVLDWSHVTHGMGDNNCWSVQQAEKDGTKCSLTYEVRITGTELTSNLLIHNTGKSSFDFQALFHTYLAVDNKAAQDNSKTYVKGLGGYTIIDKVCMRPTLGSAHVDVGDGSKAQFVLLC